MKVLMLNGSPHANGNTSIALGEMKKIFDIEDIETEVLHISMVFNREAVRCIV